MMELSNINEDRGTITTSMKYFLKEVQRNKKRLVKNKIRNGELTIKEIR